MKHLNINMMAYIIGVRRRHGVSMRTARDLREFTFVDLKKSFVYIFRTLKRKRLGKL